MHELTIVRPYCASSSLGWNYFERRCKSGVRRAIDGLVAHMRARRIFAEVIVTAPVAHGPYRPRHEPAAAVRADIQQNTLDAVGAERALVRANARVD